MWTTLVPTLPEWRPQAAMRAAKLPAKGQQSHRKTMGPLVTGHNSNQTSSLACGGCLASIKSVINYCVEVRIAPWPKRTSQWSRTFRNVLPAQTSTANVPDKEPGLSLRAVRHPRRHSKPHLHLKRSSQNETPEANPSRILLYREDTVPRRIGWLLRARR